MKTEMINLGTNIGLDVEKLIRYRMLVQANSGAGKSWLLRLIAERAAGRVQTIVLDPEGEFATLREKVDVVLAGREGEVPADPRSAALLARKLVEMGVSAVIDLYDLKVHERRTFVKLFLDSMLNLPRSLWHPVLVMIDEAHFFCPEKSAGESTATEAVINLMAQGRKRGFAGILSTQRLSKLHKDAAAEANNVFIGRTWLDVDQKRAGDMLGMGSDRQQLRDLADGEFFAFGPALSQGGVIRFRSSAVETTHPKAGEKRKLQAPKASDAIREIASQLEDLPRQAEDEIRSMDEARKKITALERELRSAKKAGGTTALPGKPDPLAIAKEVERVRKEWDREWKRGIAEYEKALGELRGRLQRISSLSSLEGLTTPEPTEPKPHKPEPLIAQERSQPSQIIAEDQAPARRQPAAQTGGLGKCERAILQVLSQFPEGCESGKLTLLSGYRYTGSFQTALSKLRTSGFIEGANTGTMKITDEGLDQGPFDRLPRGEDLQRYWVHHGSFGKCPRAVLTELIDAYPEGRTAAELCEATNYQYTGSFQTALSQLRTAGVLVGKNTERMKAADVLFEA